MAAVIIWARDFETRNLPPVCAISGRPAACWVRFGFRSTPSKAQGPIAGAHLAGLLVGTAGGLVGPLVEDLVALRGKGYLPLTRSMSRFVRMGRIGPGLALALGLLVAVVGGTVQSLPWEAAGFTTFVLAMPIGMVANWRLEPHGAVGRFNGALVLRLTNVHPNFAAAEEQSQRDALEQGTLSPEWLAN
jgi:hypothetical protein